jgi:peptide/nickel transport system ATP-binding protein
LYQGRLCEVGTVDEIYTPPFHPYTETLLGAVLEPDPDTKPILLASDTPELAPPEKGCPFQRRCPLSLGDICKNETPPWQSPTGEEGHKIRCHIPIEELLTLQKERAPVEKPTRPVADEETVANISVNPVIQTRVE